MNEAEHEAQHKRMDELVSEIATKVQEWIHLTDEGSIPSIMTAGAVVFESSMFDESGNQMYRTDYVSLPPTSATQLVGLIKITGEDLNHRMFGHCGEHSGG